MIINNNLKIQNAPIVEIFDSIQGEGKYIGVRQIFLRLAGCPLKCDYCDTDYSLKDTFEVGGKVYNNPVNAVEVCEIIFAHFTVTDYHSISVTGGEPLLYPDFLREFAEHSPAATFLETSGHDPAGILKIAPYFNYLSVDLKTNIEPFGRHADELLSVVSLIPSEKAYVKMALKPDESADKTVETAAELFEKYNLKEIWIQPIDNIYSADRTSFWQNLFRRRGVDARFVPQIHKFLQIR